MESEREHSTASAQMYAGPFWGLPDLREAIQPFDDLDRLTVNRIRSASGRLCELKLKGSLASNRLDQAEARDLINRGNSYTQYQLPTGTGSVIIASSSDYARTWARLRPSVASRIAPPRSRGEGAPYASNREGAASEGELS
jgi:hypothetical protein